MCKKLVSSISFVLVLGVVLSSVANAADPSLVGWWKFEEASGTLQDSSGRQNNGTYNGTLYRMLSDLTAQTTLSLSGAPTDHLIPLASEDG